MLVQVARGRRSYVFSRNRPDLLLARTYSDGLLAWNNIRFRLPPGFELDEEGRLQKTADEEVRSAIELIFSRFEQLGTIHRAQCSLVEDGFVVPILSGRRQKLRWAPPSYKHLRRVLSTHPTPPTT